MDQFPLPSHSSHAPTSIWVCTIVDPNPDAYCGCSLQEGWDTPQASRSLGVRGGRGYAVQASATSQAELQPQLASRETYAEFTQLQKLLQQYQRNLGAVGKAATVFTEQVSFLRSHLDGVFVP